MAKDWGKILLGTRLEKSVEDNFVVVWSSLITRGLRPGDGYSIIRGHITHKALNQLVREAMESECDTLATLDSDADVGPSFIEDMRNIEAGWEYDALQAFYSRRGWPPEAIWFKKNVLGDYVQCIITMDNYTEPVGLVGAHAAFYRMEMFKHIYEVEGRPAGIPLNKFEWFYFPRHEHTGEDGFFSTQMEKYGYKMGATTVVKAGHRSMVTTGWETYLEYLETNGIFTRVQDLHDSMDLIAEFTGEDKSTVEAKIMRGSENTLQAWDEIKPQTAEDNRAFYGNEKNGYLYDLASWNVSPFYLQLTKALQTVSGKNCLVLGPGIGGEILQLLEGHNNVYAFELPGVLKDFLKFRFKDQINYLEGDRFPTSPDCPKLEGKIDLLVAIDTIEHIPTEEIKDVLYAISLLLHSDGILYMHNNFSDQQGQYPMHFDHSELVKQWLETYFTEIGGVQWRRK